MARIISTAAINAIRNEYNVYNPDSLAYEDSILLEGSRTNSALYSEDIVLAAHASSTGVTYGSNTTIAPDGTLSGDTLVQQAISDFHFHRQDTPGIVAAGQLISCSRYLKANTGFEVTLTITNGMSCTVVYNLNTGTIVSATGADYVRSSITPFGNGWYRCTLTGTAPGGIIHRFQTYPQASITSFLGDGTTSIFVWGGQIEVDAPFPSSYIPTSAVTVTRSADQYSIPFNLPPQEMTIYTKFINKGTAQLNLFQRVFQLGTSSLGLTFLECNISASNLFYFNHSTSGGSNALSTIPAGTPAFGDLVELVCTLYNDGATKIEQVINNGASSASGKSVVKAFASSWATPSLHVNHSGAAGSPGFIALQSLKIARGTLTLAQMRAL